MRLEPGPAAAAVSRRIGSSCLNPGIGASLVSLRVWQLWSSSIIPHLWAGGAGWKQLEPASVDWHLLTRTACRKHVLRVHEAGLLGPEVPACDLYGARYGLDRASPDYMRVKLYARCRRLGTGEGLRCRSGGACCTGS